MARILEKGGRNIELLRTTRGSNALAIFIHIEYLFTSERLGFRNWIESDKASYAQMNLIPEVMRFFPSIPSAEDSYKAVERFSAHFETHGFTYFSVEQLQDKKFIGFIGMMHQTYESPFSPFVDIGWRLLPAYWGKGLATEGAQACMSYAKETLKIKKIHAVATWNNAPSIRVMKKLGMEKIGDFVHPNFDENHELQPVVIFASAALQ